MCNRVHFHRELAGISWCLPYSAAPIREPAARRDRGLPMHSRLLRSREKLSVRIPTLPVWNRRHDTNAFLEYLGHLVLFRDSTLVLTTRTVICFCERSPQGGTKRASICRNVAVGRIQLRAGGVGFLQRTTIVYSKL